MKTKRSLQVGRPFKKDWLSDQQIKDIQSLAVTRTYRKGQSGLNVRQIADKYHISIPYVYKLLDRVR